MKRLVTTTKKALTVRESIVSQVHSVRRVGEQVNIKSQIIRNVITSGFLLQTLSVEPAVAIHGSLPCNAPAGWGPLLQLLHDLTILGAIVGVALGGFGIVIGGGFIAAPGQSRTELGKRIIQNSIIGTAIILAGPLLITLIVSNLGGVLC